jgi:hypothetical protein
LNGKGKRKLVNGECYSGNWIKGRLNGIGKHKSRDEVYEGHFMNNKENGKGKKVSFVEGAEYVGEFYEGMF